jgi:hypothetical protein
LHPTPLRSEHFPISKPNEVDSKNFGNPYCAADWNLDMIHDSAVVFDRSVAITKLKTDIETATTNAEQHGVLLQDIVLQLLQRAEDLCQLGAERGLDLSRVGAFFRGDGE